MSSTETTRAETAPADDELLANVLEAHGGLDQWNGVSEFTAKLSLGGPFWGARGWPEVYRNQVVTLDPHHERISFTPFTAPGMTSLLEVGPEKVSIRNAVGEVVDERVNPRSTFPDGFDPMSTPWDAIQVAYFTSAAVWNYLTEPFVFARPDVTVREIEPWNEDGEIWRRLAVTFPDTIANHNADQTFYYDDDFMLRRMDYSPDVTGNPPVAHYTYEPETFDGFVFPTRRMVYLHGPDGVADETFAPITIHVTDVTVTRL